MHVRKNFDEGDPAHDAIEAQWMAEMGGRDPVVAGKALESLHGVYQRLILRKLGYKGIPADQVADIAQQAWLEVWQAAPKYQGEPPVRLFIVRRVNYGIKRYWSDRKIDPLGKSSEELTDAAIEVISHASANSPGYADFALCVRGALQGFGEEHPRLARLLFMRHVQEWSLAEIAETQGGEPDKIKGELFSARGKFRPWVKRCLALWPQWGTGK